MKKVVPIEYLLHNSIDKDVQDFLLPLNLIQNAVLLRKYNIRDNFMTSMGWTFHAISTIGIVFFFVGYFFFQVRFYSDELLYRIAFGNISIINIFMAAFLTISTFVANIMSRERNVQVILHLQNAKRAVLFTQNTLRRHTRNNWICIAFYIIFLLIIEYLVIDSLGGQCYYMIFNLCISISYDVTQFYFIRVVNLLRRVMEKWIISMKLCVKTPYDQARGRIGTAWPWNELYKAYCQLHVSFSNLKSTAATSTTMYLILTFGVGLMFVDIAINIGKLRFIDPETIFASAKVQTATFLWLLKNLFLICRLSAECEELYKTVTSVETECLLALKKESCLDEQKKALKNVLRVNRHNFSKYKPFSMFTVDGALPLVFGSLITTHAVVLLQFKLPK